MTTVLDAVRIASYSEPAVEITFAQWRKLIHGETVDVGGESLGPEDGPFRIIPQDQPVERGGPGSGNFDHEGRPGKVGGSAPGNGGASKPNLNVVDQHKLPASEDATKFAARIMSRIFRPIYGGEGQKAWDQAMMDIEGMTRDQTLSYVKDRFPSEYSEELSEIVSERTDTFARIEANKDVMLPLAKQAAQYDDYDEFERDYSLKNYHGIYWHLTQTQDFQIDPNQAPTDLSSLASPSQEGKPGGLMVTTDIEAWAATFNPNPDETYVRPDYIGRKYVAQIDLSDLKPNVDYQNTTRGFGHEIFVNKPAGAKVVDVLPLDEAIQRSSHYYQDILPSSERQLRAVWDWSRDNLSDGEIERHYGPGPHPGTGTEQDVHAGGGAGASGSVAIIIPADVAEPGTTAMDLNAQRIAQPSGAPIRGEKVIDPNDPIIPETVYHMTTSLSGLQGSGEISARGAGGLGGDARDQIVSMTIDENIAKQLTTDFSLAVRVSREFLDSEPRAEYVGDGKWVSLDPKTSDPVDHIEWNRKIVDRINELDTMTPDWKFDVSDGQLESRYTIGDWFRAYFIHRTSGAKVTNPVFMTDPDVLAQYDLGNIGYVSIPKGNLNTGALLMDFDLDRPYGLQEVRLYGDVPLDGAEFHGAEPAD